MIGVSTSSVGLVSLFTGAVVLGVALPYALEYHPRRPWLARVTMAIASVGVAMFIGGVWILGGG